jgi:thioredoxin-dependent peroxiredoxin
MKYFIILISTTLLASCTIGLEETQTISPNGSIEEQVVPTPTSNASGTLEFSSTGSVNLSGVMNRSYRYLDSEKKSYATGTLRELLSYGSKGTIVYFYPKDGTPNCTIQALDFSMMLADFRAAGYDIIGISKDSIDSHKTFAESNALKIKLLQDGFGELLRAFGAEGPLQEYGNGHELSDIIRSTYVVDTTGKALYAFRDVTAKGHARRIYELITGNAYTK